MDQLIHQAKQFCRICQPGLIEVGTVHCTDELRVIAQQVHGRIHQPDPVDGVGKVRVACREVRPADIDPLEISVRRS
ncbi:MAG: hypothetical protein R3C45_19970 [Phycisphaerales bacterium]